MMKHPLSARRLAFSVSSIATLRLTPKEDFTLNAQRFHPSQVVHERYGKLR
jgi:hypothetical protein